jgi:cytochrome c553
MRFVRAIALAAVVVGCASKRPTPFPKITTTLSGVADSVPPVDAHAWQGVLIRDAVVRGDLPSAQRAAADLIALATKYEKPAPGSRLEAMVEAAHRVEGAQDLHEAARSFAFLSERCGECHSLIGGPVSGPSMPPPQALGIVPRMRRHQWASSRLWEGLVAPSSEAWTSGAQVLTDAPLGAETLPAVIATPEIAALSTSVHDLGVEAAAATRASARIAIYGKLLGTCAECHQRVGRGPR